MGTSATPAAPAVRRAEIVSLTLAGLLLAAVMLWVTAPGIGVSPDSVTYFETAANLLRGQGLVHRGAPLTHYPPLYPLLLAAISGLLRVEPQTGARLLAALCYGLNGALLAMLVLVCTEGRRLAALLAMVFFALNAPTLDVFAWAWSEPPFVTLCLLAYLLLARQLRRPRWSTLLWLSLAGAAAAMTRYIGLALGPALGLALLLLRRPWKRGLVEGLLVAVAADLPLALWLVRNAAAAGIATNRRLVWHPVRLGHLKALPLVVYDALVALPAPSWAKGLSVGLLALLSLVALGMLWRRRQTPLLATRCASALLIFVGVYTLALLSAISLVDVSTPVDQRQMLPAMLLLVPGLICLAVATARQLERPALGRVCAALLLVLLALQAARALPMLGDMRREGLGYNGRSWQNSALLAELVALQPEGAIYANDAEAVRFITGLEAARTPLRGDPFSGRSNPDYAQELARRVAECQQGEALLVYFSAIRIGHSYIADLDARGDLPVLWRGEEGVIYGLPQAAPGAPSTDLLRYTTAAGAPSWRVAHMGPRPHPAATER